MTTHATPFHEGTLLHELKHYLPSQAPLKDFIHHNTLHAFEHRHFHDALRQASEMFGAKTYLPLQEYRARYSKGEIRADILEQVIIHAKGAENLAVWKSRLLHHHYDTSLTPRVGQMRAQWKKYGVHLDKLVHPILVRILASYLDQGISIWRFPKSEQGLLAAIREIERASRLNGFITTQRARSLLFDEQCTMPDLLRIVVGDERRYEQYIIDQQFAHPGWSGMVAMLEEQPQALLDPKPMSLHDAIMLELLLEIEMLDREFSEIWSPLGFKLDHLPHTRLFEAAPQSEVGEVFALWQESFEWSYYDLVLAGICAVNADAKPHPAPRFQAMFCLDDRECSIRRHLERTAPSCQTFGTPGFFNVDCYFQPEHGKFYTKICPAPLSPKHLIKEIASTKKQQTAPLFTKQTHSLQRYSLFRGWLISQTLGFWSAMKLLESVFKPSLNPATSYSFRHLDKHATLTIEYDPSTIAVDGLQVGFTVPEMAERMEGLLKSTGLVGEFAPLVYFVGHGASSMNNTHYATYDCGACSGRPGSVNARVAAFMANHAKVREILNSRGITIPPETQFIGALHDTTRDEIEFFDEDVLTAANHVRHAENERSFAEALALNAKERARRFVLMNPKEEAHALHQKVKLRSVSLFEPRPELNHATNTLCIVGRRTLTDHLFLDRRAFMNSYDYRVDPDGAYLLATLQAAVPVCGGINLEYYFSRVDNYRLGAGTKLPHNVIGLIGVANGTDGDLRTGLPSQMIEIHDPTRLLMIVEHLPEIVLKVIQSTPELYRWFDHEWGHLVVVNPETKALYRFSSSEFVPYKPLCTDLGVAHDLMPLLESSSENLPVTVLRREAV